MKYRPGITVLGIVLILVVCTQLLTASTISVPFDSTHWTLKNGKFIEYLGRPALVGAAQLKDVQFLNGIIEVDIAVNHERSYPGFDLRDQGNGNYEHFYIRPHRAGHYPDALQYTPSCNNESCWQLYSGPGYTSETILPVDEWVNVRLEIKDKQARMFIGGSPDAELVVPHLYYDPVEGAISLSGPADGSAYFSNFTYSVDEPLEFDPYSAPEEQFGMLRDWQLSGLIPYSSVDLKSWSSSDEGKDYSWQNAKVESNGLVNLSSQFARGRAPGLVFAKTTVRSDSDKRHCFRIGYSDIVYVYLNGELAFSANSQYRYRDPSFTGIIGLFDELYLPLEKGENELVVGVVETFGGWGFMVQDAEAYFQHPALEEVWSLKGEFAFPEAIRYEHKSDLCYVSNYYTGTGEFVSAINPSGEVVEKEWLTGLARPTGIAFYDNKLHVVDRSGVTIKSLDKKGDVEKIRVEGARFLNDIDIDKKGIMYLTDSGSGAIYKIENGQPEIWVDDEAISQPNGILVDGGRLLFGNSGDGTLKAVDFKTKEVSTVASFPGAPFVDGIVRISKTQLLVSDYKGKLYLLTEGDDPVLLLDVSVLEGNCADIGYLEKKKMIFIPNYQGQEVKAYKLDSTKL